MCPYDFADHVAIGPLEIPLSIRDVSGKILTVYGTRRLRVFLDGTVDTVIPFIVADVTRPIVSLGKLTKQDVTVHLERQSSRIERGGRQASLISRHNASYFNLLIPADGARACAGVAEAPAAADPRPSVAEVEESLEESAILGERPILGPGSSVGALKQRLKELGQPIYGEKAMLWRRLADAERRESARLGVIEEASRRQAAMRGGQPAF